MSESVQQNITATIGVESAEQKGGESSAEITGIPSSRENEKVSVVSFSIPSQGSTNDNDQQNVVSIPLNDRDNQ